VIQYEKLPHDELVKHCRLVAMNLSELKAEKLRAESLQAYTTDRLNEAIRENYGAPEIETSKPPGMGDIRNAIQRVVNGSRHGGKFQGQRERESLLHEVERLREALREGIDLLRQLQSCAYAPRVEVYLDKMDALEVEEK